MTAPLRLTDEQLDIVMRAAEPLASADRGSFLEAVAGELQGQEIGDGIVARICAELQRRYLSPPVVRGAYRQAGAASRTSGLAQSRARSRDPAW
jgi:hypothetical protein